jgi:carboxyl-terminal processing protease
MFRRTNYFNPKLLLLVLIISIAGALIGIANNRRVSAITDDVYGDLKVFTDVINHLQKDYVEETEDRRLIYGAIKGMLDTLDPHSSFMPPEIYREMQMETKGKFEGLGIVIEKRNGLLTVVSPIEDTPAFEAGIKPGDHIIRIDGETTKNLSLNEAAMKMRGPKGTKVTITITREGFTKPKDITLVRDVIPLRSVRQEVLEKGIGYIRLSQFNEDTASDFERGLQKLDGLNKAPLKGLIVDLRNNPGGLLDQAVKVADKFLVSGMIVSIEGRNKEQKMKFTAHREGTVENYPIVVLVNGGSASGSEILAGALQDHRRALILGTRTFGKGSVQTIFPLKDGSGLKLTTARYYTPSGKSIQAMGITPNIIVPYSQGSKPELQKQPPLPMEKDLERHLETVEPAKEEKEPKPKEEDERILDSQLERALQILKSWEIFQQLSLKQ